MARATLVLFLLISPTVPTALHGGSQSGNELLIHWLQAVEAHAPGEADGSAVAIGGWSKAQLLFILREVGKLREADARIQRGAVLHLDIALRVEARATGNLFMSYPRTGPGAPAPPLLVIDGRDHGRGASATHLEFARALLQKREPDAFSETFVRLWYIAAAAELALGRNLAELEVHLDHARRLYPHAAEILLASGYLHEAFASPRSQAVVRSGALVGLNSERANLQRAERYFREALSAAPALAEARLRLGRVLALQRKHAEAVIELQHALRIAKYPTESYYALLFLGREEELLGRLDEARRHFERAAALYPLAQSPRLSLSRLAAERGDGSVAQSVLERVIEMPPDPTDSLDPWWQYDLGPGRYAGRHVAEMYGALNQGIR
jgi:tetratricopeptide (TPR) repeat protein